MSTTCSDPIGADATPLSLVPCRAFATSLLLGLAACGPGAPVDADLSPAAAAPRWIWGATADASQELLLERTFSLAAAPATAELALTCDNHLSVRVNGHAVGTHGRWEELVARDVADHLVVGANTLSVEARNDGGPAGLCLRLDLGDGRLVVSDDAWSVTEDGSTTPATDLGEVGDDSLPWSGQITLASFDGDFGLLAPSVPPGPQPPKPADTLTLLPGFEAELLYSVPNDVQGSWVALCADPEGRLYASDQGDRGLFRITPAAAGDPLAVTEVERVDLDLSSAQGLTWAFDSLYVMSSGRGLFRLTDSDGDDALDRMEQLIEMTDSGEHGIHAVLPTPDGEALYVIGGNHSRTPDFESSRAPSNWGEDLLLPRDWDPSGHARGRLAPGGWIARCDPDGTNVEIVSTGYRNQYDIALTADGELFTYDADMEWDLGLPWYRPTRICHATSGSEFGWRSGTGKWPSHYEDSLPATLDLGPGSPTGLLAGTGLAFPARYSRALYALDWTFGTIYAVHLEPDGASYTATAEEFAWSKPLALTDAAVGADGAMYFTVGGRGTASALYRVRYAGDEPTDPDPELPRGPRDDDRIARRALERFHGNADAEAVDAAWPLLGHADRFLRFAARVALESQPVSEWRARALAEADPATAVVALLALARQGEPSDLEPLLASLAGLDLAALDEPWSLIALRAHALAFVRLGEPDATQRERAVSALEPLLPTGSSALDTELIRLLVYLDSEAVVPATLELIRAAGDEPLPAWAALIERNDSYGRPIARMLEDMPPVQALAYAFPLRNASSGWTPELRREYFEFLVAAADHPGGNSYGGFLEGIRDDAADLLPPADRRTLADLIGRPLIAAPPADVTPPEGPGRQWTAASASAAVGDALHGRDFDSGRNLYHAAACSLCHPFDGQGGALGPDLTSVASTFSIPDLLEAIVEPSKVISDQYGSHTVTDRSGRTAVGMLVEADDEVTVYPRSASAEPAVFARAEIASIEESTLSQMPAGLVDALNPDELRDLVAYLLSGGDRDADVVSEASVTGSD